MGISDKVLQRYADMAIRYEKAPQSHARRQAREWPKFTTRRAKRHLPRFHFKGYPRRWGAGGASLEVEWQVYGGDPVESAKRLRRTIMLWEPDRLRDLARRLAAFRRIGGF